MLVLDVDGLLEEISPDAPCGEDLEYDGEYGEMERATVGKEEQQFGDTVIPAEDPDWKEVKRKCLSLLKRTKDIRIAAHLARAELALDGFEGFCDVLSVIRGYVEKYWDTHHPQLDPDDDNDPTFRVNTLISLCDLDSTLRLLREAPLVASAWMGKFGLFHVDIAEGEVQPPADMESVPDKAAIDAAFQDAEIEKVQGTYDAVKQSIENVETIESVVTDRVGAANAASLEPLVSELKRAKEILEEQLRRRGAFEESEQEAVGGNGAAAGGGGSGGAVQAITGEIGSRQDVVRTLDKICEYYERHEPSSPIPLLLRRAKRLASMSFMEILRELTPGGVDQAIAIGGADAANNSNSWGEEPQQAAPPQRKQAAAGQSGGDNW